MEEDDRNEKIQKLLLGQRAMSLEEDQAQVMQAILTNLSRMCQRWQARAACHHARRSLDTSPGGVCVSIGKAEGESSCPSEVQVDSRRRGIAYILLHANIHCRKVSLQSVEEMLQRGRKARVGKLPVLRGWRDRMARRLQVQSECRQSLTQALCPDKA